jgi:hypothetical protein
MLHGALVSLLLVLFDGVAAQGPSACREVSSPQNITNGLASSSFDIKFCIATGLARYAPYGDSCSESAAAMILRTASAPYQLGICMTVDP